MASKASEDLLRSVGSARFGTVLADPPWQFMNRTGKVAPEHRRLSRYGTMKLDEITALPVGQIAAPTAHLYLWCPNALLPDGLSVMKAWGFTYKSNLVWHKIRKDGGSDGRGVGFYFRNVTELILFGVRGKNARTLGPARTQVNLIGARKREHSCSMLAINKSPIGWVTFNASISILTRSGSTGLVIAVIPLPRIFSQIHLPAVA